MGHRVSGILKWLGVALLPLCVPASATETGPYPANSVLLFVASWCAPCHAELTRLPAITRGARPFRVLVVPFDDTASTRTMMEAVPPTQRWQPTNALRRQLTQELAGTSGLPFSVAVDGAGHACANVRKGLDGLAAEALVAACNR
jgi:hypothetical protein